MNSNRRWIKSTPSPVALRDQVYRNCLSEVKSKRNGLVQQFRQGSPAARNELMKSFVSEVYNATKLEHSSAHENTHENSHEMEEDGIDAEYQELLNQIADAIEFELAQQQAAGGDNQFLEMEELEAFARVELCEQDENTIICPLCSISTLIISEATGTASCSCGALVNLQTTTGLSPYQSPSSSQTQLSQSQECDEGACCVITASELRARLANAYDRHLAGCSSLVPPLPQGSMHTLTGIRRLNSLEYQLYGGHLCAFCARCSFYEQIT